MRLPRLALAVLVTGTLATAACSGDDDGDADVLASIAPGSIAPAGTEPTKPPLGTSTSVFPDGDIDHGLDPYVEEATSDLAQRLGVDPGTITLVSAVLVEWPDSSLGCPEPDMAYSSVLTDGAVIELAVGAGAGRIVYRYHSGGAERPFLCEQPLLSIPTRL